MTRKKPAPADPDGLDREIEILRELIHKAAAKQSKTLEFDDQLELLETVGKTAPALARLLKARRELANQHSGFCHSLHHGLSVRHQKPPQKWTRPQC